MCKLSPIIYTDSACTVVFYGQSSGNVSRAGTTEAAEVSVKKFDHCNVHL